MGEGPGITLVLLPNGSVATQTGGNKKKKQTNNATGYSSKTPDR